MKRYILFLFVMTVVGCGCAVQSGDPAPVIRPQPGAELCSEVAAHIGPDGLNCPEGLPVPVNDGGTVECEPDAGALECISLEEFCVEQHQKGIYWNTECMVQITDCAEIETVCNNGGGV